MTCQEKKNGICPFYDAPISVPSFLTGILNESKIFYPFGILGTLCLIFKHNHPGTFHAVCNAIFNLLIHVFQTDTIYGHFILKILRLNSF